ncbi:MAG: zinc-ribbon domain-containing protein [Acidobacteria bacterium]|nr:zinc-ribbon domain-containing protein [Acidobacteriota bacterium]
MPFCSKCGFEVQSGDLFCGRCGAPQSDAVPPPRPKTKNAANDPFSSIDDNTAAVLCYIPFLGWIASIYILSVDRFRSNNTARFHAFQGLYLFVGWLIYDWVIEGILYEIITRAWIITRAVKLGLTAVWLFLLFKTSQREMIRIPFISDLADKSVAEQR